MIFHFLFLFFHFFLSPPALQCLIPEVPFKLYGDNGMFGYLEKVLSEKGHAVLCVAEGAAQDLLATGEQRTDASGNPILKDVGVWLKDQMKAHMKDVDVKYIDPSALRMLRTLRALGCTQRACCLPSVF